MFLVGGGLIFGTALAWGIVKGRSTPAPAASARGMVRFAGGPFVMGMERAELDAMCATYPRGCPPATDREVPPRPVTVAPFDLDEREVTNEEFASFLTSIGPSIRILEDDDKHYRRFVHYALHPTDDLLLYDLWQPGRGIDVNLPSHFYPRAGLERQPVTLVTWLGARLYCRSVGKRLPTEAEWELAARGPAKRHFPWGNEPPDCGALHIWTGSLNVRNPEKCDDAKKAPNAVMTSIQDITPERVHDMGASVSEWVDESARVNDDDATYVARLTAESAAIHRGGSYATPFDTRSTSRNLRLAFNVGINIGFRCAKSIASTP